MNQAFYLLSLQQIDLKIDKVDKRSAEINKIMAGDKTIANATAQLKAAETLLHERQKALKSVEAETYDLQMKIELSDAALYGGKVRNPKELQSIQEELRSLRQRLEGYENQQLEALMQVEEAEAQMVNAQKALDQAHAALLTSNAHLAGELRALADDRGQRQMEREALLKSVQPNSLEAYERLRAEKRGIAVAKVDEMACESCGSMLTPAEQQKARSPLSLAYCPSCGRIIYAG